MSRIGKVPIEFPSEVKIAVSGNTVKVEGPKGKLEQKFPEQISVKVDGNLVVVSRKGDTSRDKAFHGLIRSLVKNMVIGVSKGFEKKMEIVGTGYRAKVDGKKLNLVVGHSHPVNYSIPEGINVKIEKNTIINIDGPDKQLVGAVAADIRAYYPPEPYKGKGIKFSGEHIRRKAGKSVAK